METGRLRRCISGLMLLVLLLGEWNVTGPAFGQFGKMKEKATELILCGGGAVAGFKLGEKLADMESKRMHLPPGVAEAQKRKFEIGLAMAFCNGGKLVANTTFAALSKRDRDARQTDLDAAIASEQPVTKNVALPDHPGMTETITTEAAVTEGNSECKTVKDHVAEGDKGDDALVKYCRKPPDGKYAIASGF